MTAINIPARIAELNVNAGERIGRGQKCRIMMLVADIETLGIADGARVSAARIATYWIGAVEGTVTGLGQEFDKKGNKYRYVYVSVDIAGEFIHLDTVVDGVFREVASILRESGDLGAARNTYDLARA